MIEAVRERLRESKSILLAGAGGGFDIYCGLPLYHELRELGFRVYLANLSFSDLMSTNAVRLADALLKITSETSSRETYFPERWLSEWLRIQGEPDTIYALDRTGVLPLIEAYQMLIEMLDIDTVILVDGGTDSLMRGDEYSLGTPEEDAASIAAVDALDIDRSLLISLGFGIDRYHGICHAQFLQRVAELAATGDYYGAWSILPGEPAVEFYRKACNYAFEASPEYTSIVNSSILAAVDGEFGDRHATSRTSGSRLFINPLMGLYWAFNLKGIARQNLYLDQIRDTSTYQELQLQIERFRMNCEVRTWTDLPM